MSEKKIGEFTFVVEPLLATKSLVLKARIMKVIGSAVTRLPEIVSGAGEGAGPEAKAKSDAAAITAFTDIFTNGDPIEMVNLVKEICEVAKIRSAVGELNPVDFDREFTGKDIEMFQCCIFVLKEVFGDFLAAALANGTLKTAPAVASQPQS